MTLAVTFTFSCLLCAPSICCVCFSVNSRLSNSFLSRPVKSKLHTAVGTWQRTLRKLFKRAGIVGSHARRCRDTFSVEFLLSGVPIEDVSILLGHKNIKTTLDHYAPWSREHLGSRLETQLNRAWQRDPIVLLQEARKEKTYSLTARLLN